MSMFTEGRRNPAPDYQSANPPARRLFAPAVCSLACLALMSARARAADRPASAFHVVKDVKIRYLSQGSGEPVILIHGLHSSAEINWQMPGTLAALARNHQVVALDLPGHGGSDRPEADEAYGLQLVDDVIGLMDHLRIRKAHIVGYSVGGMIALKLVALHPDRVLSGTLGGMGWLREGSRLQQVWERMPVRARSRTPAAFLNNVGAFALSESALRSIKTPVLVLVGDRDQVKTLYVAPLQAVRPEWPVILIPGAWHLNCIMKNQFADEIVKWVDRHSLK